MKLVHGPWSVARARPPAPVVQAKVVEDPPPPPLVGCSKVSDLSSHVIPDLNINSVVNVTHGTIHGAPMAYPWRT